MKELVDITKLRIKLGLIDPDLFRYEREVLNKKLLGRGIIHWSGLNRQTGKTTLMLLKAMKEVINGSNKWVSLSFHNVDFSYETHKKLIEMLCELDIDHCWRAGQRIVYFGHGGVISQGSMEHANSVFGEPITLFLKDET